MKRLATVSVIATASLGASASSAAAAEIEVSQIVCRDKIAKPAWVAAGSRGDANRNEAACMKGKRATDELAIVPVPVTAESGGCDPGYTAVSALSSPNHDLNQNSVVCYDPTGRGSWADDYS